MPKDFGYFGKGLTGYAQYMTAFNRNNNGVKKPSGGNGGCLSSVLLIAALAFAPALLRL